MPLELIDLTDSYIFPVGNIIKKALFTRSQKKGLRIDDIIVASKSWATKTQANVTYKRPIEIKLNQYLNNSQNKN